MRGKFGHEDASGWYAFADIDLAVRVQLQLWLAVHGILFTR
jgi:hypothetical protein